MIDPGENGQKEAPPRMTFGRRLTLATTLISCCILLLTGVLTYIGTLHGQRTNLDATLMSIARSEIVSAEDGPNGMVHVHEEGNLMLHSTVGAGYVKYARIKDARDHIMAQTANLIGRPSLETNRVQEERAHSGQITFADIFLGREPLRCIYYPFQDTHGRHLLAEIAISRRPMEQVMRALMGILLLALLIGGGAAALSMQFVAQRMTRSLREIAIAAHQVGERNLFLRIPHVPQDRELYEVTSVLDQMLERLETALLTQQELIVSQRRFVADASHELRSPLSNLRSTVEVALRRPRSPEDYTSTLQASLIEIERLSRLVNDLLTLSRADAGQFRLNLESCDLLELVCMSASANSLRAIEADVCISTQECVPIMVVGDSDRLRQAIDNLLDNALRYAPARSTVKMVLCKQDKRAILSIQDSGPGLPVEVLAHVFDRFFRADASRTRQSGGMGLGLAIVKAIVDAHGGAVSAENVAGQGAAFRISLPLADEDAIGPDPEGAL